ncbi:hypothetical protein ACFB49_25120 [Sphingomonas sp. DBB INV C78]
MRRPRGRHSLSINLVFQSAKCVDEWPPGIGVGGVHQAAKHSPLEFQFELAKLCFVRRDLRDPMLRNRFADNCQRSVTKNSERQSFYPSLIGRIERRLRNWHNYVLLFAQRPHALGRAPDL